MPTLYYTDISNPDLPQQRITAALAGLDLQIQPIPNKHAPLALVDNKLVLYQSNAISLHLSSGSKLLGCCFEDQIDVYSWLEYFNLEIGPLVREIGEQIFGKLGANEQKYSYAFEELKKAIKILDDRLKMRTYLVGDSLTLADVVLCCQLEKLFRLIITSDIRKKFVNVTRWFTCVRSLKPFQDYLGKMFLCQNAFKIDFPKQESEGQTAEQQVEKKEEPIKAKTQQKAPKQAKKKEQKQKKSEQKEQQKKEQKQGQFNLDSFKRAFQNSEDKAAVIDNMLATLGEGWSIWKVYYSKDVTEGKVDYLTCNLAKGTLQRLDQLRKTGFGNWGVYYSEESQEYEIRGVMLWKGEEVATAWKEHPSHEYHLFEKLDPRNPEHQTIIKQYWLEQEKCQGLTLHDSYKLI